MATETVTSELIRAFVLAGHGDLEKVKTLLAQHPQLLHAAYEWGPDDHESAIQAAAHVGNRLIALYLLERGAPLEICTAAMLGRREEMEQILARDPSVIATKGAHGIPLLTHAALSGDAGLIQLLYERGATTGATAALVNAAALGHIAAVRWLLEHASPKLDWKNFQGKTAQMLAEDRGHQEIVQLLQQYRT